MENKTNLSAMDKKIMNVIWKHKEVSNADIHNVLPDIPKDTIKKYTLRLLDKGLVGLNKISARKHKYYPLISKKEFMAISTGDFIKQNYDSLSFMVAGLIENEQVSDSELDDLEKFIKEYRGK